jgi:hypothetical protein
MVAKHIEWEPVTREAVKRAVEEYDRLGANDFFAAHGYAPATTYELLEGGQTYPPKAILGTAYELATGRQLSSPDFEGGKSGAVRVLTELGFAVQRRARE